MSYDKKWEMNPEAAETVRLIFKMALEGHTPTQIRDTLFQRGCPTPKESTLLGRGKEIEPLCRWTTDAIVKIIKNEQYTGTYISNRFERITVGSINCKPTNRSEWIVIPDNHPALVSKEDFDRAQTNIVMKGKTRVIADKLAKKRVKKDGSATGLFPLYGYIFDQNHNPVINPKAAEAIRLILKLTLEGSGVPQICEALTQAGFPTPGEQKAIDRGENVALGKAWTRSAVNNILRELQYTGIAVSGRSVIAGKIADNEQKSMMPREKPQSEWQLTPKARPAIISEADFNAVQELLTNRPKECYSERNFLLKSKARCGACGHSLDYNDGVGYPIFRCRYTIVDPRAECHKAKFVVKEIDEAVLSVIRKQAEVVLKTANFNELLAKENCEQELVDYENRVAACNENRQKYYESFILREIERPEYLKLKAECSGEIERLNKLTAALQTEIQAKQIEAKVITLASRAVSEKIPRKELVDVLIDIVLVFPDKRIEIVWKIEDFARVG